MKTEFSFNYAEKRYVFSAENNAVYELEKGITVQVVSKVHNEYDAVEWLLYFENQSGKDSQIFSQISDCDTLLPVGFAVAPKAGYRPVDGDACIITMNGMVDGFH